ncbi:GNAT family N-acetyltransferase [Winogradskya humida]|uniref:Acetyltransferase n=1 Tax=Winogradskya humida TaxID=113566 RepID=A0ABQ3ZPT9_9ACTN|nr:GNAT family N-acetyltransferase [Actinoplanes humidus]GIE20598.1 acetyltransferase [Actinoplanes humidus]
MITTDRLHFRQMTPGDLDDMAALLGSPEVMLYYPRPRTRAEAQHWIDWNLGLYAEHGFGLWILSLRSSGEFVGDCGLTYQQVDGVTELEIGYHVRADLQGLGLATEAASAVRDHARDTLHAPRLTAIINPANTPSQRVATKIGLKLEKRSTTDQLIFATSFT